MGKTDRLTRDDGKRQALRESGKPEVLPQNN